MNALLPAIRAAGHSNIGRGRSTRTVLPSASQTRNPKLETRNSLSLTAAAAPNSTALARILRPPTAHRWLLPQLAAITPTYIESVLRGGLTGSHIQSWELFDLMEDTWPELASCVQELKNAVARKRPIFEPFREEDEEPTQEAIERQKLVSAALRQMQPQADCDENGLSGLQFDILDAWFKGVSVQEIDWTNPDGDMNIVRAGKLGDITAPRSTIFVHPQHYAWGIDGRLGLRLETRNSKLGTPGSFTPTYTTAFQPSATEVMPFPQHKFIVSIRKARSGSAQVGALLRPLAWWWCAANFSADWLMNLAQIFGLPFRWANYSGGASQQTIDSVCSMLENMGSHAWAAFPEGTTLELKEPSKSGDNSPQGDLLDRANAQARQLILGQTMSGANAATGAGKGAGAFGKQEGSVKEDIIEAAGDFVCEVINAQVIPAIIELNYGEVSDLPRMSFVEDEEAGPEQAQVVSTLAGVGMKFSADELYKRFGFRKPRAGEETIGGEEEKAESGKRKAETDGEGAARASVVQPETRNPKLETSSVAELLVRRLGPLVEHAKAIAAVENPLLRSAMFEDFLKQQPAVLRALSADPTLRDAIEQMTGEAFVKGAQATNP